MRINALLLAVVVTATLTPLSLAQRSAPSVIDYCQLVQNAQNYSGTEVRVRGWVSIGFEDFTLHGDCDGERSTWLDYGDDVRSEYLNRILRSKLTTFGFRRNEESRRFNGLIHAFRVFQPSGEECDESCSYYKVYATFTGLFLAPDVAHGQGLGHMGCCYELIMREISDVTPQRTGVPFGGRYECSTEYWTPTADEYKALLSPTENRGIPLSYREGVARREQMFSRIAAHWGDSLAEGGRQSLAHSWSSVDLMNTYTLVSALGKKQHDVPPKIARQVCKPVSGADPIVLKSPVECSINWIQPEQFAQAGTNLEMLANRALEHFASSWGVTAPQLQKNSCFEKRWEDSLFGWCAFTTDDGMHSVSMHFTKGKVSREPSDKIAWRIVRGAISNCAESSK